VWREIEIADSHALRAGTERALGDDAPFVPTREARMQQYAVDFEALQLDAGLRRLVKRERGTVDEAERAANALRARGVHVRVYVGPSGRGGAPARAIAFAAREPSVLERAIEIEEHVTMDAATREPLVREMGELLGYPLCCVDAFAHAVDQDDRTHFGRLAHAQSGVLALESNWAATMLRPFSHFPCEPACDATLRLAAATLERVGVDDLPRANAIRHALATVVVSQTADRFALLLDARSDGPGAWCYEGVVSLRNLATATVLDSRSFRAFYLEVIAPLEAGDRVERTPDTLVIERAGRRIARVEFAPSAPRLLDFTGRTRRHLPIADSR
jgi:hypothetical protein